MTAVGCCWIWDSIHSIDSWNEVMHFCFLFFQIRSSVQSSTFSPSTHRQDVWEGRERIDELLPSSSISIDFIVSDHHAARVGRPRRVRRMLICAARFFIWNKSTNIDELHFLSGELINSSFFFSFSSMKMFSFFFLTRKCRTATHRHDTVYSEITATLSAKKRENWNICRAIISMKSGPSGCRLALCCVRFYRAVTSPSARCTTILPALW